MSSPASGTVISYPVPAYANVPIHAEYYEPNRFIISAISLGVTTTITTTTNINYVLGQQVRLIIPPTFGTRQLNERSGIVIDIPASNQVTLNIDSQGMDTFVSSSATTKAQILAIGDYNSGQLNANVLNSNLNIPGSFINTSPN
jgi:hypothetical protein